MKYIELLKAVANEGGTDLSERKKIGEYVNRAYRECAKRTHVTSDTPMELKLDEDSPLTHEYNDEFIINYALYMFYLSKNVMDKAQIHKSISEDYKLKYNPRIAKFVPDIIS